MEDVKKGIQITVDVGNLDIVIEKVNRLVELLREAQQIVDSLFLNKT